MRISYLDTAFRAPSPSDSSESSRSPSPSPPRPQPFRAPLAPIQHPTLRQSRHYLRVVTPRTTTLTHFDTSSEAEPGLSYSSEYPQSFYSAVSPRTPRTPSPQPNMSQDIPDHNMPSASGSAPQPRAPSPSMSREEALAHLIAGAVACAMAGAQPIRSSGSSRITLAERPPMFDGEDKSKWSTWYDALTDYIGAYRSEFYSEERKVYYTISLLGKSDGSVCPASVWKRNWKKIGRAHV